ncbi:hypothetical protein SDC9_94500 [bioreactor metagenome]|uniref:Sulfatase N-terminal domain-containing protein n=1 Tax=bioreactor metagenome TaxID=1076179 RepID=A0A645A400_9ZZZZ|nr:LTA synthase family protein [Erysipelotrichaceae bacterium]
MRNIENEETRKKYIPSIDYLVYKMLGVLVITLFIFILNLLYPVPEYGYCFTLLIALIFCGFWIILPLIADKALTVIGLFIYTFYILSQRVYFNGFGAYFDLKYASSMTSEVAGVGSSVLELIKLSDYLMLGGFILTAVIICLMPVRKGKALSYRLVFKMVFCLIGAGLGFWTYNSFITKLNATVSSSFSYNETDLYIYDIIPSTEAYVAKFGINAFLFSDIYNNFLSPQLDNYDDKKAAIDEYLTANNTAIDTNDHTGIFEGKNLIIIQGESLMTMGIDETLTPTLYHLMSSGIYFENFSAPLLAGSTSDTEIMVQNSIYPMANGYATMHTYANNTFPISLAQIFKNLSYHTTIFHNNYGVYYNRSVFYGNDAYDKFYDTTELGLENLCSDAKLMDYASWIVAEQESFYAYFITYSGHQPYSLTNAADSAVSESAMKEYKEYITIINQVYPGLDEFMQVYLAKCMSLDRGISSLITALESYGKLEDTVIVILGDHVVKGYDDEENSESLEILNQEDPVVPLIIWNVNYGAETVEKYCNSLDVLPTLMNMFSIDYDKQYVFGSDIFDDNYIGYYFTVNGTVESTDFKYDYLTGLTVSNDFSEAEAYSWIDKFNRLKEISQYIIETDYFGQD